MISKKVKVVDSCCNARLSHKLRMTRLEGCRGDTHILEGTVVTRFGTVEVSGSEWYADIVSERRFERQALTRMEFVHCSGKYYPSSKYIREFRGRLYSPRYCAVLARRFAAEIAV